jgi:3-dehydroquinate synthase
MGGFAAACYQRGIAFRKYLQPCWRKLILRWRQTGVNHPLVNMIALYQPHVIADADVWIHWMIGSYPQVWKLLNMV